MSYLTLKQTPILDGHFHTNCIAHPIEFKFAGGFPVSLKPFKVKFRVRLPM